MENMFLEMGMGWTTSKTIPYILCLLLGLLIFWLIRKRVKKKLYRWLAVPIIFIPVVIYFAINPIYEGDFSNNVRIVNQKGYDDFKKSRLTVVAIPGCPYCLGSIERLKKYSNRTGEKVDFMVLTSHAEMVKDYKQYTKGTKIKVKLAKKSDFDKLDVLAQGSYPAFVFRQKNKLHVWNNDGFGVRALDWVESN